MKKILLILSAVFFIGLFFSPFALCSDKPETTISYISINDLVYYDVELLVLPDGKVYLPFKQLAELFEISVTPNHLSKEITFKTLDNKDGIVSINSVKVGSNVISDNKNYYIKTGLMDEIRDEIFVDEHTLSKIFGSSICINKEEMIVIASTSRKLAITAHKEKIEEATEKKFKAYTEVLVPADKKSLTLDTIGVRNNTVSDSYTQVVYNNSKNSNIVFNNNTQIVLKGKAYNGDYIADYSTFNYAQKLFSFGGMGVRYDKKYKDNYYEYGKITGLKTDNATIGSNAFGVQVRNFSNTKTSYKDITGEVTSGSLVNVYVDGEFNSTLNTYNGYYTLENLYLLKEPKTIKIEEVKEDGTTEIILEKEMPQKSDKLLKGEVRQSGICGVSGFTNRLFAQNGSLYAYNAKKLVLGYAKSRAITEKLDVDHKIVCDKIIQEPNNMIWGTSYLNVPQLYSGTFKNPNTLEGITYLSDWNYDVSENLKLISSLGLSSCRDKNLEEQQFGYKAEIYSKYKKGTYNLNAGLYNYSSDFYAAGVENSAYTDRIGGKFGVGLNTKFGNFDLNLNKYYSNLNNKFAYGLMDFTDSSFRYCYRAPKIANLNFSSNSRYGKNDAMSLENIYYNLDIDRQLTRRLQVSIGKNVSNFETKNDLTSSNSGTGSNSEYSLKYLRCNYTIPKDLGRLQFGNETVTSGINEYQIARLNYSFPSIKRVNLSLGTGYRYKGNNNGLDYSVSASYRCKSGRTLNVSYNYSLLNGYMIDNMFVPGLNRQSVNFSVNDNFAVSDGLHSIGSEAQNIGFVEAVAYLDTNKNGKYDSEDVGVKGVPIKCSWKSDSLITTKNGKIPLQYTKKGIYQVNLDTEKLPATLSQAKESRENNLVRIDSNKTTKVEFPLISSVGNITGKLKVIDGFNRKLDIKEFIIVLLDEKDEEVSYTTVDDNGHYYISGISPGKYTVRLDQSFIDTKGLEEIEGQSSKEFEIPYVYEDFVDINDLDLTYKTY